MANTIAPQRTDIRMQDVFISWTGKDRELKDRIVGYLRENGITVLESDHDCVGDFRQWSREAVHKCTVFLSLYTENTVHSEYVPVEIEELKKLDDWRNRFLPVVSDYELYSEKLPDFAESESAVVLKGRELSDKILSEILHKVQKLINNRLLWIYRNATKPTYLKIRSFLRMVNIREREFNYESLYIHRTVTAEDGTAIDDASVFTASEDIFFLQGPAGSGKSCYIDQLREAADENVLVVALPCRKLTGTDDIFKGMFEELSRHCGNRDFYTEEDFKSLLSVKHLLLVLDGMDEIATKDGTRRFLDAVSNYYKAHASSTTLFFTSRNMDDADIISMNGQTPKRLILRSLEEDQIKQFGKSLFLLLEKPDKSDAFYLRIKDLADEIRTNPLLLSQLAIIYDKKDSIPQTTVGIYDAVCEITLSHEGDVSNVPDIYRDMVTVRLPSILKSFSAERYRLMSVGKQPAIEKILAAVLKNSYDDGKERAVFLADYLSARAMIIDGEFYHKMLLEYFTAVYYYEHCFDDYDELEDQETLKELFAHYDDPYWSAVLQLFLVKADSLTDCETTATLYRTLMTYGITEYTLLFDTCRDLLCHKEAAQGVLVGDILTKSADGTYPPYGPLFWYVPEYSLYTPLLLSLGNMTEEAYFTNALALTRDVCLIFGHYNTANEITDRVNCKALFAKAGLKGVRRGLCELFYTGDINETGGGDIYPRCFNIAEAKSWKTQGQGVLGRMSTLFEDELGLYSHEMLSQLGGEYIGIVAAPYDRERLETVLPQKSCQKLCGLFFSPTEDEAFGALAINDKHLKAVYAPENVRDNSFSYRSFCMLDNALLYFYNTINIPYGVMEIGKSAFKGCKSLEKITIPDSVTKIEFSAFEGCTSLAEITIPESVRSMGGGAFEGCTSLAEITIPNSVWHIGFGAFSGCTSLKEINIPDSVTEIGKSAFEGCTSLAEITIPNSVWHIGFGAFEDCKSLEKITIPDSVRSIGGSAFKGCTSLKEITIPDSVTVIGGYAFEGCTSLKEITIPYGVKEIGGKTFACCTSLKTITIPDSVTEIGCDSFEGCTSLKEITIPNSVAVIGESAFNGCTSLKEITIPDSVGGIEGRAFAYCKSLAEITIPAGVTVIGECAFRGCTSLKEIAIPDGVREIGERIFEGCTALKRIINCPAGYNHSDLGVSEACIISPRECTESDVLVISQGTTIIQAEEFSGRRHLKKVILPDGVTKIEFSAFKDCTSLTEINIPAGVTKIEFGVFKGCTSLAEITIPNSVTKIEFGVFEGCASLKEIKIPDSVTVIGRYTFKGCTSLAEITIPAGVTVIGECAFRGCTSLKEIAIPDSVTKIEFSAFEGCTSLREITIPDSVREIDAGAFEGCTSLREITFPAGVTKIEFSAFKGCTSLENIAIPYGVTKIEFSTFESCTSLREITIPDSVTEIGHYAFNGCTSLKEITIPAGVTKIEFSAFEGCTSLREITIPDSVREIDAGAFEGCTSLKEITIPDSVTKIEFSAFKGCTSLTGIIIPAGVREIGEDAFGGCTELKEVKLSRRFEDELPRIFSGVELTKIKIVWH